MNSPHRHFCFSSRKPISDKLAASQKETINSLLAVVKKNIVVIDK
jgi:hypothetical protein